MRDLQRGHRPTVDVRGDADDVPPLSECCLQEGAGAGRIVGNGVDATATGPVQRPRQFLRNTQGAVMPIKLKLPRTYRAQRKSPDRTKVPMS